MARHLPFVPMAARLVIDDVTARPDPRPSTSFNPFAAAPDHAIVAALRLNIFLTLSDGLGLPGPRTSASETNHRSARTNGQTLTGTDDNKIADTQPNGETSGQKEIRNKKGPPGCSLH